MKNIVRILGIIALVAVIGLTVTGCSGSSPKSLAKQTYDLYKQIDSSEEDAGKLASLAAKAEKLKEKVEKLSEADQEIFAEELDRLMDEED